MSFISARRSREERLRRDRRRLRRRGGQTAYTLTMDGARVLMLEAGGTTTPGTETPMFQTNAEAPLRGSGTPDKPFGF